jgi:DNA-binding HxlR family transcriptional regulator
VRPKVEPTVEQGDARALAADGDAGDTGARPADNGGVDTQQAEADDGGLGVDPRRVPGHGPPPEGPRVCSIADALDVVGERYSLLVLRELGFGVTRFSEIRRNTGAPRETLATRLRKLEDAGVITRRRYSERPPRDEYLLTESGRSMLPILGQLRAWGAKYAPPSRGSA